MWVRGMKGFREVTILVGHFRLHFWRHKARHRRVTLSSLAYEHALGLTFCSGHEEAVHGHGDGGVGGEADPGALRHRLGVDEDEAPELRLVRAHAEHGHHAVILVLGAGNRDSAGHATVCSYTSK